MLNFNKVIITIIFSLVMAYNGYSPPGGQDGGGGSQQDKLGGGAPIGGGLFLLLGLGAAYGGRKIYNLRKGGTGRLDHYALEVHRFVLRMKFVLIITRYG